MTQVVPRAVSRTQRFEAEGVVCVIIDTTNPQRPRMTVWLNPDYVGELDFESVMRSEDGYRLYLDCDSTSCVEDPTIRRQLEKLIQALNGYDITDVQDTFDQALAWTDQGTVRQTTT